MIRKTRKKIIRLLVSIYAVLMMIAILLIYVTSHKDNDMLVSRGLAEQLNNLKEFEIRSYSGTSSGTGRPVDNTMPPAEEEYDLAKETCIYTVIKHDEELSVYYTRGRKILDNKEITEAAEGILSGKKRSGTWKQYQYEITIRDDDLMIAFADITVFAERERKTIIV